MSLGGCSSSGTTEHSCFHNSQEPVDCNDEGDVISREPDGGEDNHHSDQAGLRDPSSSDACRRCCDTDGGQTFRPRSPVLPPASVALFSPNGDDLTEVHLHVVDLRNEDGGQSLVQSRSIHVDGGAHRQHEPRDPLVDPVVLLQTLEGDGERGGAARTEQCQRGVANLHSLSSGGRTWTKFPAPSPEPAGAQR